MNALSSKFCLNFLIFYLFNKRLRIFFFFFWLIYFALFLRNADAFRSHSYLRVVKAVVDFSTAIPGFRLVFQRDRIQLLKVSRFCFSSAFFFFEITHYN